MKLLFTKHWKPLLICIGVTLGGTVAFYTYTNFILKFMNDTSGIAKTDTSVINFWALFIFMLLQPVYGMISDKIGRKPLLLWFGVTGVLFTWPLLSALAGTKDPFVAFLLMMGGLLIVGGYTSINALVKAELFPASIRALGVGLGYAHRQLAVRRHRPADWCGAAEGRARWICSSPTSRRPSPSRCWSTSSR